MVGDEGYNSCGMCKRSTKFGILWVSRKLDLSNTFNGKVQQVANVARFSGPNKPPFWTFHWGSAMIFFMKISRLTIPELVWRNDLYDSWSEVNQAAYRPSKQKKVVMALVRELSLASHKVRHQQIQTFNVIQYIIRS